MAPVTPISFQWAFSQSRVNYLTKRPHCRLRYHSRVCALTCGLRSCWPQKKWLYHELLIRSWRALFFNFDFHTSFLSRIHWLAACSFRIIFCYVKLSKSSFIIRYYEHLAYFLWAIIWFRYSNNKCTCVLQFVLSASNTKVIIYGIGLDIILHALALNM